MKLLYIFNINNDYFKLTKDNPYNLYMVLSGIKNSSIKDVNTAFILYRSLSNKIDDKILKKALNKINKEDGYQVYDSVHSYNNYFNQETSKLFIHNSYLILKTNNLNSIFLRLLKKEEHFFVIDFTNKTYFWLSDINKRYI